MQCLYPPSVIPYPVSLRETQRQQYQAPLLPPPKHERGQDMHYAKAHSRSDLQASIQPHNHCHAHVYFSCPDPSRLLPLPRSNLTMPCRLLTPSCSLGSRVIQRQIRVLLAVAVPAHGPVLSRIRATKNGAITQYILRNALLLVKVVLVGRGSLPKRTMRVLW